MPRLSRPRITVRASAEGIKKAQNALVRLGFDSKTNFAKSLLLARNAVTRFFHQEPLQPDTFKRICDGLKLDWKEILETEMLMGASKVEQFIGSQPIKEDSSSDGLKEKSYTAFSRQITVTDEQKEVQITIVLQGDITSIDANFETTLEILLKKYGGSTIQVIDIQEGSIRITISGSMSDVKRLIEHITTGELTEIGENPVEEVEVLSADSLNMIEGINTGKKWKKIQRIVRRSTKTFLNSLKTIESNAIGDTHSMSIEKIVEQALQDGYLTPAMEAEVGRICDTASELSIEEYMALDRLMGALLTGEVVAVPRKQFINVMEELVLTEAISRVAEIEVTSDCTLDLGDIAAYALNRLPPLYATTEEGANYQRMKAKDDLHGLIIQQVSEAIARNLDKPELVPDRHGISKTATGETTDVLSQVSTLLQAHARKFEAHSSEEA